MTEKRKVRTTLRPTVEIEVEGPEYLDLHRQGLLLPEVPPAPPEPPANTAKGAK